MDRECCGGGHLIGLIGETASGKTSILNSIRDEAHRNGKNYMYVRENHSYDDFIRVINSTAEIKIIDWIGNHPIRWMNDIRQLRSQLIDKNQWAIIATRTIKCSMTSESIIKRIPMSLAYMSDFLFSLKKEPSYGGVVNPITTVTNIKNRYKSNSDQPTKSFQVHFQISKVSDGFVAKEV